jgi:hypothetical protein
MMPNLQKIGALAAFVNAVLGVAMLLVAFVLLGPALTDSEKLIDMALHNPMPLILQDILKFASVAASCVLVWALSRHIDNERSPLVRPGSLCGFISILFLLANACLSLYATTNAARLEDGQQINLAISLLGLAAIFVNGFWYLFENLMARKNKSLPGPLIGLGLVIGVISLVPFLGIFVLVLSLVWSVWLGIVLLRHE